MTWLILLHRWHAIPIERPVEATEEELLAGACTLEDLLTSETCDGVGGADKCECALLKKGVQTV